MFSRRISALGSLSRYCAMRKVFKTSCPSRWMPKKIGAVRHIDRETAFSYRMADPGRRRRAVHDPCEHGREPLLSGRVSSGLACGNPCPKRDAPALMLCAYIPRRWVSPPIDLSQFRFPVFPERRHEFGVAGGTEASTAPPGAWSLWNSTSGEKQWPSPLGVYCTQDDFCGVGIRVCNHDQVTKCICEPCPFRAWMERAASQDCNALPRSHTHTVACVGIGFGLRSKIATGRSARSSCCPPEVRVTAVSACPSLRGNGIRHQVFDRSEPV